MNHRRTISISADPACNEPSQARRESRDHAAGGGEPDPTDDNLRALRRLRDLSLAVAEKLAARILEDDPPLAPADAPKRPDKLPAVVLAFQRAERGVRQCVLLSNKLYNDRLTRETQNTALSAKAEAHHRERRKNQVAGPAKKAVERDPAGSGGSERLEKPDMRIDEERIDIGRIADSVPLETPAGEEIEPVEAKAPQPEPDSPYEARMKARLSMAMRSGAWLMALQMDPALTTYVRSQLINSS